ncbi:integrase catalytic domain-containing protein [Rubritalea sp.]|uniref:integrase catalytic domain-containing protein n=1 Tax=Rubritalea sp. TaxID=2109375 RepID=UPI003EF9F80F
MRERYTRMTGRRAKTKLLDELVEVTGWERKHANKVILGQNRKSGTKGQRGAPAQYNGAAIEALKSCWLVMNQPCGKRMKDMLLIWVPYLEVSDEVQQQLKTISAASIDRSLKNFKVTAGKKVRPPKPASGVKILVEVRAESWSTCEPEWTEVDTVAHCGGDMSGSFVWTLTSVDAASGWTELRAIWNRGQHASLEGLESIYESQPFKLLGVDSDNGGEFLNYFVYDWLKKKDIHQTRSRPYF